ncbi:MAG: pseudouridine-5'-phosphate glycosidase, partial [Erysipelotrichaceae bacterium]|nr:pseudouridine-5'-phosphate glycosidase [Erysipelotrichaceae bacterium]
FGVDYNVKDEEEVAKIMKTKWDLGLNGGILVGNPIPHEYSMDHAYIDKAIDKALEMAKEKGIHGKATTPFLLATIKDLTGGSSLASNLQLAYNNARVASRIAVAYHAE